MAATHRSASPATSASVTASDGSMSSVLVPPSCSLYVQTARRARVSSRTRPAWDPACASGVRALCCGIQRRARACGPGDLLRDRGEAGGGERALDVAARLAAEELRHRVRDLLRRPQLQGQRRSLTLATDVLVKATGAVDAADLKRVEAQHALQRRVGADHEDHHLTREWSSSLVGARKVVCDFGSNKRTTT